MAFTRQAFDWDNMMLQDIAEAALDEFQGERAISRWDNEGGAGPGRSLFNHQIWDIAVIPLQTVNGVHSVPVTSLPNPSLRTAPQLLTGLRRGASRSCPACGLGKLFSGYLAVRPQCAVCGNDNEQYPSDDFAPYVTIAIILHVMVPILIIVDRTWDMSVWLEGALALPIFSVATLALLPFAKGGVIGFAWAYGVTRR